ncbi:trifunctional purine biosynthetic protein adenosine-3-related [Holotrichia oblita]|nr:trifunctional purine biosynthetic protein adenosine-3-related [Holotrichia oblita]
MDEPVLVSGTDGVGTKLKIAFLADKHDTVGIDCVAMCVNDIICSGAKPLFFLDYIACGKNVPLRISSIVKGISEGCVLAGVSLIGGETAEMPGFYSPNEYDLAGFAVGLVDKNKIINGAEIKEGDAIIGLASNGLHSNGFSLVRSIIRPSESTMSEYVKQLGATIGEELLKPTRIYVKSILELNKKIITKGICNITGGGFIENIPRMLPPGCCAKIFEGSWKVLPIFDLLQRTGEVDRMNMYNTFNMGIGMAITVSADDVKDVLEILDGLGETAYVIGEIVQGEGIDICLK